MQSSAPLTRLAGLGSPPSAYQRLQDQLAQTSWICQGTLVCRPLLRQIQGRKIKKGPYYLWTCKQNGKTVCAALSKSQYHILAQAIQNNRRLQRILDQMQTLTMKTILRKVPGVRKRK
jgi:hypothetical protein